MTAPLPLPATPEAWARGCRCFVRKIPWLIVEIRPHCPLHSESARAVTHDGEFRDAQPVRLSGSAT